MLYSTINLLGLSISMAFVLLLAVYVQQQLSTDSFHENGDRIYVVANDRSINMGYYLPRHLKGQFPEIESFSSYCYEGTSEFKYKGEIINAESAFADSSFFDMFGFKLVNGSSSEWKSSQDRVMISESFALAHFQNEDPVGRQISYLDFESLTIAGVFEDINNSVFKSIDVFIRGEYAQKTNSANDPRMSNAGGGVCYIMTYPGADIQSRSEDILSYLKEIFWIYQNGTYTQVKIVPLRDIYFLESGGEDYYGGTNFGDRSFVKLLSAVCLILLLFAILNYVNMTTALMGFRAKEMATRRLVGAQKSTIFIKMILESISFCAVSMILAVMCGYLLSSTASSILNYPISLSEAVTLPNILLCFAFIVVIGIIAGIVPALLIQKTSPIDVVKGTFRLKTKTIYSKIIIIVQNVVTVTMIVVAFVMYLQVNHLVKAPLGYNNEDILVIDNNYGNTEQIKPLIDKLKSLSCVEMVGLGNGHPLSGTNNYTMELENGEWVSFQMVQGDSLYFNILGIREKQDNHIPGAYWLNECAFKKIGNDESALKFVTKRSGVMEIGGIYYDFRIGNILDKETAILLYNNGEFPEKSYPWDIIVKTVGDQISAKDLIHETIDELFPGKNYSADYSEVSLRERFKKEDQIVTIIIIFTILSLIVSALGLLAMSSYYMQQEIKSVSIKKVFGADFSEVLYELVFSFLRLVMVASIVAVPLSYFIMRTWLQGYSYRIDLYWWIFIAAGAITLIIAAGAVLWQSVKAANSNPAIEMKKE